MNAHQPGEVDQALFGYSEGHRQIATSFRLPSRDQYLLAAASDLAAGSRLGADDSYLTGLPLPECRRFALIRTWSAPEMPRPGCVWSHVLLIDAKMLSSYGDLSNFLTLLKRPHGVNPKLYGEPLPIGSSPVFQGAPSRESIAQLIRMYYSGETALLRPMDTPEALEAAIMAVWSQQWPRLRMTFSFRTAMGGERRRHQQINYDVQVGLAPTDTTYSESDSTSAHSNWATVATADAAISRVTPLRRFLWRYGRDLITPRKHFRTLVQLYLAIEGESEFPPEEAIRVFEAMPETADGEILKRDILGIGSASPSLCVPLSVPGLLPLLASGLPAVLPTEEEISKRINSIPAEQIPTLATYLDQHRTELGHWADIVTAGLIASANHETLRSDIPKQVRTLILLGRPDLIDRDVITSLSDDAFLQLLAAHGASDVRRTLANEIVRRDFGRSSNLFFRAMPNIIFEAAIEAILDGAINPLWRQIVEDGAGAIIKEDWINSLSSTLRLSIGLSLLRYPIIDRWGPEFWLNALSSMEDDATGENCLRLQAYLLRSSLKRTSAATWQLLAIILPVLRPSILQGVLPYDVYQDLQRELPTFRTAQYWDINKRLLLWMSEVRETYPTDRGVLGSLGLSDDEVRTVTIGHKEEEERAKSIFWFWS